MTITYPYALPTLADLLPIESVVWDIHRNDELSGSGDARIWQAELADPLWMATVALSIGTPDADGRTHNSMKQIAALIRKLHGAQESFLLYDPLSKYPQADPTGTILGASTVSVHTAGTSSLRLQGLPPGYELTLGDKGLVEFPTSPPEERYFFEVSEDVVAAGTGITPAFEVFPHVPVGVTEDNPVTLIKPACKMFIVPGSHKPGEARGIVTAGAGFTVMERRR